MVPSAWTDGGPRPRTRVSAQARPMGNIQNVRSAIVPANRQLTKGCDTRLPSEQSRPHCG